MTPFDLTNNLTAEQEAKCAVAPKFETVTPSMLFGPACDFALANRVCRLNPARYRELRQRWRWETNQEPRPEGFYD
jgi:hypothetical protein